MCHSNECTWLIFLEKVSPREGFPVLVPFRIWECLQQGFAISSCLQVASLETIVEEKGRLEARVAALQGRVDDSAAERKRADHFREVRAVICCAVEFCGLPRASLSTPDELLVLGILRPDGRACRCQKRWKPRLKLTCMRMWRLRKRWQMRTRALRPCTMR